MCPGTVGVIRDLCEDIILAAKSSVPILISGESGRSKVHLARLIHRESRHSRGDLVSIRCAGIAASILECELLGLAGGTLLLDDVGEMDRPAQEVLERFLDVNCNRTARERETGVRVMAATGDQLFDAVGAGRFPPTLFYRLNGVHLHMPPLAEGGADLAAVLEMLLAGTAGRAMPVLRTPAPTRS